MDYEPHTDKPLRPDAAALIETFRAIGYSLSTALADLLDNSISAGASKIWIDFIWDGEDSTLSIRDNGKGMDLPALLNAMKPGSKSPSEDRQPGDLGRFGLGLKTASFSQCRSLTVISKEKGNEIFSRTWDLDYVVEKGDWYLLAPPPYPEHKALLEEQERGTVVIWDKMDRLVKGLVKDNENHLDQFLKALDLASAYLAMVFHRFMETGKLKIYLRNNPLEPWDPFLKHLEPECLGEEVLTL